MLCYNHYEKRVGDSMNRVTKALSCIGIFSLIGFAPIASAASTCDYETQINLRKEANNVNATYEVGWYGNGKYEEGEIPDENGNTEFELLDAFTKVAIYNITENLIIDVVDKATKETTTYYFEDTDNGTLRWEQLAYNIMNYDIIVKSNHSDCRGEEYRTISFTTPKFNRPHAEPYCNDNTEYYCEEFITKELNLSDDQIYQKAVELEVERNKSNAAQEEQNKNFLQKYGFYIIGAIVIVILRGVGIRVILVKVKRSKTL